jgi:myo-inositol-1-phosphate synthase
MGDGKVRVAIIGVGNCASALIQGVFYYQDVEEKEFIPGIMHANLNGYHIRDIEFVAAFDVDANKVGKDLSEAVFTYPNNTAKFCDLPKLGVKVARGLTLDGLGKYYKEEIKESSSPPEDVVKILKESKTDVVVNYLPVGSEEATCYYVEKALEAGCSFVNCIPVFIANSESWRKKFEEKNLPLIGDDIKSQIGATILHRSLAQLFNERGVKLLHTYQLNFGGNMDFKNMLERERLISKKISKTGAVESILSHPIEKEDIHIGPSDYVAWLKDRKWAYIRLEGVSFGDLPLTVELKLEVWDSPNSAGVSIDAIRCAKIALDKGIGGALLAPSAYFMKSPPVQYKDTVAHQLLEEFISSCAR